MNKKKLKHSLISNYYLVINPFRKLYWYIFRPKSRGAKAVIFWEGKVLLARISYAHKNWVLPGGGVKKNESFRDAALREAAEEVGIKLDSAEFFYEYQSTWQCKRHTVQCFSIHARSKDFVIDEQEISEADWFSLAALPADISPNAKDVLLQYSEWRKDHV